ncbi:MAG: porphobilinogen synthase [Lentisphaeria bacterium]|nr:porphobilinogen synthase [Lentisphaeria bacterium]
MSNFPTNRMRRLRSTQGVRNLFGSPFPEYSKFIWPVFVIEGENIEIDITSMPNQKRYSIDRLIDALSPLVEKGLGGIMLFGVIADELKTEKGDYSFNDQGLVQRAIRVIKERFPDLVLFTDVCMCAYTCHGHCGILRPSGQVLNDPSLEILAKMAVSHAKAGADGVGPSAMMDGQVSAIRKGLDQHGFTETMIMSYSTKFASAMYGPFREAADSSPSAGDRKSYQQQPNDLSQAIRESLIDEAEGADILMVKPALYYLDVISKIKEKSLLPLAAYNVSGEYSMIFASAQNGWGDLYAMARESIVALDRAGTDIFLTYWANQYDEVKNG